MSETVIYKYPVTKDAYQGGEKFSIPLPEDATIINVGLQGEALCFWAELEKDKPVEDRPFIALFTGDTIKEFEDFQTFHLQTVQRQDGFVFHVYELI